jgi:hypothetical protein
LLPLLVKLLRHVLVLRLRLALLLWLLLLC